MEWATRSNGGKKSIFIYKYRLHKIIIIATNFEEIANNTAELKSENNNT